MTGEEKAEVKEIHKELEKIFGPNPVFPEVSVLHLEFEIPKRWSNKVYAIAGKREDPFPKMEALLEQFLESDVRLVGFTIND